jgi:hypothetical protein
MFKKEFAEIGKRKRKSTPTFYLQLDNASNNKSKLFLAFIAYLIEKQVFHTIKLSYLIVGQLA